MSLLKPPAYPGRLSLRSLLSASKRGVPRESPVLQTHCRPRSDKELVQSAIDYALAEIKNKRLDSETKLDFERIKLAQLQKRLELANIKKNLPQNSDIRNQSVLETSANINVETSLKTKEGKYAVSMPLKKEPSCLGNSKDIALKRLGSLWNRLARDENYLNLYREFLRD
ncbi:hypothetical protein TNCV_683191 [Trichonephila clavipes]|nr:hypothetical protein TNCV_683191 [Trichonephila clavipes]